MSEIPQTYLESERKYLVRDDELHHVPDELLMAPARPIEQYYLNHHTEPYELRLRRIQLDGVAAHLATVKKGSPPDRLEMETMITPDTYEFWLGARQTEPIRKTRQTLEFAAGHWALDSYMDIDLSIVEAEGDVPHPTFGHDVTHDTRFTNYELAQVNDAKQGHMPDSFIQPEVPSDIAELKARIEYIRQQMPRPIIIGLAGDTASGKTTLAKRLAEPYGDQAIIISQDHYYRGVTRMRQQYGDDYVVNFDAPISIDSHLLANHLSDLQEEKPILRPTYSMETSDPTGEYQAIDPTNTPIIFVEGIHALDPVLTGWYDLSLFVNAPLATRVGRRLERDLAEGRSFAPEDNLRYLMEVAEPTYQPYAKAQKAAAELIFHT